MQNWLKENWFKIVVIVLFLAGIISGGFSDILGRTTVTSLPPFLFLDNVPGLVGATGTFAAKGEELANKFNSVEIQCFNKYGDVAFDDLKQAGINTEEMYCYIAQGDVIKGYLSTYLSLFPITDWDKEKVVAEKEGLCRKTIMTLDRRAKSVTQTSTLINNEGELCSGLSPEPIQSYLTNGFEAVSVN
ncbi:MAG: hypothetical protein UV68_C0041G0011 [Candidatus Collierbacteria bacterium GW2011_GWC2_43_12]|uniref:Uncharacterized protein n=1 Tax=Candidatus Collierbacteria bacterium GW2011_GWC2_43_12 TaxID=1618390 RepID=A0A0G1D4J3_9BACT|nr:MAG: hypothetical protein UV68_C0041G0011 [Candidatus Collierbacteria bacterium GW2011_GWC2_43_12]